MTDFNLFVVIYFKTMYNKTIIRFVFYDIRKNQGLPKCCQPRPSARLITLTSTLIIPDITKTESNNCLTLMTLFFKLKDLHFGYSKIHVPSQERVAILSRRQLVRVI